MTGSILLTISDLIFLLFYSPVQGAAGLGILQSRAHHPPPRLPLHADPAGQVRRRPPEAGQPRLLQGQHHSNMVRKNHGIYIFFSK